MMSHFENELLKLKQEVLHMSALVEDAIASSIDALKNSSIDKAQSVINNDRNIDELELQIEELCQNLLLLQHPVASDLRFVTMAQKITNEMERMADLAVDIAQRTQELEGKPLIKPLVDIPKLGAIALKMMRDAINSFIERDQLLAGSVINLDSEADKLRNAVQKELIYDYMMKDASIVPRAVPLLLAARHLERICDHATNIAEDVIYMQTAKVVKHHPEKLI